MLFSSEFKIIVVYYIIGVHCNARNYSGSKDDTKGIAVLPTLILWNVLNQGKCKQNMNSRHH